MISIRRGPAPPFLLAAREELHDIAWEIFGRGDEGAAAYQHFEPLKDVLLQPEFLEPLAEVFHDKCAFCESRLSDALEGPPVDHFRPRNNTINFEGDHFPRHYFWRAGVWTNLHYVCIACNRAKGNRFPLRSEARRASVPAGPEVSEEELIQALDAEQPLLIDPCRDDPLEHLTFDLTSGAVVGLTEEGGVSIELFDLNRPELIEGRTRAVRYIQDELAQAGGLITREVAGALLSGDIEYAAIRRQAFARWARDHGLRLDLPWPMPRVAAPVTTRSATLGVKKVGAPLEESLSFSVDADGDPDIDSPVGDDGGDEGPDEDTYYRQSRKIEKVVLRDFRSIEHLELELSAGTGERAGWTLILGENGTGKSTILHGIALALAGGSYRDQLTEERGVDAAAYVRRASGGKRPTEGTVEVYLTGLREPERLEAHAGEPRFTGTSETRVLLLGYGSTRLLPRTDTDEPLATRRHARIDNLFDPFVPLADARGWLLGRTPDEFKKLAASFGRLLDLGSDLELIQNRDAERIDVAMYDAVVPLEQLSDGYQSVVALTADIMSILHAKWGSMAVAEGVVLLDELGAHLHPKWRMRIVKSLRETFPRVQFIVTTHDPLCLRGLADGEVIVTRRDRQGRVMIRTDLPPVAGLRVDQLLTSEHFGLASTLEPNVERDFDAYYELLAKDTLSEPETKRLKQLRQRFESRHLLGSDRRERLMLEAIDRHLAREANLATAEDRERAKGQLEVQLDNLLAELEV